MVVLIKRQYLGEGYVHTFRNDSTGELVNIPCTQQEYEALAQIPPINPVKKDHTWLYSQGGTVKVDTSDSLLGVNEYCDYKGGYLVSAIDVDGFHRMEAVNITDVTADQIDEVVLKTISITNTAEAIEKLSI